MTYTMVKFIIGFFFLPVWWLQKLIKRKKHIWVFGGWYGQRFSDNSKYLYSYIKKEHPEIICVWLTRNKILKNELVQKGHTVYMVWQPCAIYYSLLASIVIVSSGKKDVNRYFINGAKWIQLWHGNPMKKIGRDDKFSVTNSAFQRSIVPVIFPFICECNYHYVVSNAEIFSDKMASAFKVAKSHILETGCPRNDVFFEKQTDEFNNNLRSSFEGCRLVYYLPTFRGFDDRKSIFSLKSYDSQEIELFLKKENIVFVTKGHFVDDNIEIENFESERIVNLSDHEVSDINFMLKDADVLITDYSGAYFDFLLTQKPIILAPFDLVEYKNSSRELYFDYESIIAGPMVMNWSELKTALHTIWNDETYTKLVKEKNDLFNKYHDNKNSERVYKELKEINK